MNTEHGNYISTITVSDTSYFTPGSIITIPYNRPWYTKLWLFLTFRKHLIPGEELKVTKVINSTLLEVEQR